MNTDLWIFLVRRAMTRSCLIFLVILTAVIKGKTSAENGNGPAPLCKNVNKFQSSVNIHNATAKRLTELNVVHEGSIIGQLTNNGVAPTVTFDKGGATLRGGPLDGSYKLQQFHFHFGCDSAWGSDHTMDGKAFPAELQLLFFNKKYAEFSVASTQKDGLAAVAVFLKKRRGKSNSVLKALTKKLPLIKQEGASVSLEEKDKIILEELVPDLGPYYTYNGSFLMPPCYKSVQWIILQKTIKVSKNQLRTFRKLKANGDELENMCNGLHLIKPSVIYRVRN